MSRKLQVRHRALLELIYDVGISQYRFALDVGIGRHRLTRLLCDSSSSVDPDIDARFVEQLIRYGIYPELAIGWAEWVDPDNEGRPRLYYILREHGLTLRQVAHAFIKRSRRRFLMWLNHRIEVHGASPMVKQIAEDLIPWLIKECGFTDDDLAGWQIRISPEQRTEELIKRENLMNLSAPDRKALGLRHNPFTLIPFTSKEFWLPERLLTLVEDLIDAAEQGLMTACVGSKGCGKSTIKNFLIARLSVHGPLSPLLSGQVVTKKFHSGQILDDILDSIAGLDARNLSINQKVKLIAAELRRKAEEGTWHVLILDEADKLTREELLAIKQLNEIDHEGRRLLAIILFGQEPLARVLDSALLQEVANRTTIFSIEPLGDDLAAYLKHRLAMVSSTEAAESLLTDEAWAALEVVLQGRDIYPLDAHKILALILKRACVTGAFEDGIDAECIHGTFNIDSPAKYLSRRTAV